MEKGILKKIFIITFLVSFMIMIYSILNIDLYTAKFILPMITIIMGYLLFIKSINIRVNNKAYYLLGYIILIIISNLIIPIADVNKFLNYIVVSVLTIIFIYNLINPNFKINVLLYKWIFKIFPNYLFSNTDYIGDSIKETKLNNSKFKEILIGLLITIPLLIILVSLLSSADIYFSNFLSKIMDSILINLNFSTLIKMGIIFVFSFIIVFSTTINIYNYKNLNIDDNIKKKDVSNIISYIILGFVNLVYVLFLVSEISKLTTNFLNIPVEYTYAKYAREGFFQLLGVSTINYIIIIFYQNFIDKLCNNKVLKSLLYMIIGFSIFIIFNSYYRMGLYIFEYGFTVLRLQVILFLMMELIFFIILIFRLGKVNSKKSFKYFVIMLVTYFLNIYLCNEYVINYINDIWFKYVIR